MPSQALGLQMAPRGQFLASSQKSAPCGLAENPVWTAWRGEGCAHEVWAWPWVRMGLGFQAGGWVRGFLLNFRGWGTGLPVGRLESWAPGQALLQTHSVTWLQSPQMSTGGMNILESLHEGDEGDGKVRTRPPLGLEPLRPGLPCALCPGLSHLSSLCLTRCL